MFNNYLFKQLCLDLKEALKSTIKMFPLILVFYVLFLLLTCSAVKATSDTYDELNYLAINNTSFTTDYKPNNNSRFVLDADLGRLC